MAVGLIAMATLMMQIIQTRIVSVVSWYHMAFFVISTAMFGMTAGAIWVFKRNRNFAKETICQDLSKYSTYFALSIVGSLALQSTLAPQSYPAFTTLLIWFEFTVCLAIPFIFSGIVITLALMNSPYSLGKVYGADLVGAAIGCLGVLAVLDFVNGPSAVLWVSVLVGFGAVLFAIQHKFICEENGTVAVQIRQSLLLITVLVSVASLNSLDGRRLGIYPVSAKEQAQIGKIFWFEKWNSFSRIVVSRPFISNMEVKFHDGEGDKRIWRNPISIFKIDGAAQTGAYGFRGDLSKAGGLKYRIENVGYWLPGRKTAAIIGVGGGADLISARVFGYDEVTGVEINPILNTIKDLSERSETIRGYL